MRGGIFQGIVRDSNQAVFAFVFGHHLAITRGGRRYTLSQTGNLFSIGSPGAPVIRPTTSTDTNLILAAVSGRSINTGARTYKAKGRRWPFYYGIQPTGRYPDEPFIKELYYNNVAGDRIRSMKPPPVPKIVVPNHIQGHHSGTRPVHRAPTPTNTTNITITSPGDSLTCPHC